MATATYVDRFIHPLLIAAVAVSVMLVPAAGAQAKETPAPAPAPKPAPPGKAPPAKVPPAKMPPAKAPAPKPAGKAPAQLGKAPAAPRKDAPPAKRVSKKRTIESVLKGARLYGKGVIEAYSKNGRTLFVLPKHAFRRIFLWYAEVVSVPTGVVGSLDLGGSVVSFQRRGKKVFIRDLSATFAKRSARQDPRPGQKDGAEINPIELAIRRANEPPIIAVLPVVADAEDGRVLVNVTSLFSGDIPTMSARPQIRKAGMKPAGVSRPASYITSVRVFPKNFGVRAHLTFLARPARNSSLPLRGVSLRVGHSIVMLPETPMVGRPADPRIGYFTAGASVTEFSDYTEYGGPGNPEKKRGFITRFRLVKKVPGAAVSDPVKPIVFYVGREVPDRWRPYIKAGIEMWKPAFRAAGFSNAIVARDAPAFSKDPNWTPEDARYSVIRWLAQPNANARGPHIVDPRSGEILASHIEAWPQVISYFGRYYFAIASSLDPRANSLPLSEKVQGLLLQYTIAHEVGHAIGLRHNHIASTAYTVAQMRDPKFANKWGPNASIMAYGRWNQVAQPGDGVTKIIPGIGPYDYFAVKWGYGVFGKTPAEEKKELDRIAREAQGDRRLIWSTKETTREKVYGHYDPRVLRENTGAERIEATRLGIANILRSLARLETATKGDDALFAKAFSQFQNHHLRFLKSVAKLVGGVEADPFAPGAPKQRIVPAARQEAAVRYLLGEGARTLDAYKDPRLLSRASVVGGTQLVEAFQAALVNAVLTGPKLELLEGQKSADPKAYGVLDLARDTYEAVWGDLSAAPRWRRALQIGYLRRIGELLELQSRSPAKWRSAVRRLARRGYPMSFAVIAAASGTETVFPAWVRDMLPKLAKELDAAAVRAKTEGDRLHFKEMASRARKLEKKAD